MRYQSKVALLCVATTFVLTGAAFAAPLTAKHTCGEPVPPTLVCDESGETCGSGVQRMYLDSNRCTQDASGCCGAEGARCADMLAETVLCPECDPRPPPRCPVIDAVITPRTDGCTTELLTMTLATDPPTVHTYSIYIPWGKVSCRAKYCGGC